MSGFPVLPQNADIRQIVEAVNTLQRGKFNAVTTVTLAAGAGTTTLTDRRIGGASFIGFTPLTANAAGEVPTLYVSARAKGSATLTHTNAVSVDRTYSVLIIG